MKKKIWTDKTREIVTYLFWGGLTTVVSWGSYWYFSSAIGLLIPENVYWTVTLANILSWLCAMAFAFVMNKRFVFCSRSWAAKVVLPELAKFTAARLATGLLEIAAVPILVRIGLDQTLFGVEGMAAKILVSVIVVALNYVFSKLFIFKG